LQHGAQTLGINRLGDVVIGSQPHGLHRAVDRALRRHHNHRHCLSLFRQPLQQLDASHARHLEVGDHDGRIPLRRFVEPIGAILGGLGAVAPRGNEFGEPAALVLFIFDNQYLFVAHSLALVRSFARFQWFDHPRLGSKTTNIRGHFLWSKAGKLQCAELLDRER
jgi:hypothetical protein